MNTLFTLLSQHLFLGYLDLPTLHQVLQPLQKSSLEFFLFSLSFPLFFKNNKCKNQFIQSWFFLYITNLVYYQHMNRKQIELYDMKVIFFLRKYGDEFARIAFFVIFTWFGVLKMFELSPATPLVVNLFEATFLRYLGSADTFLIIFGLFEVLIGIIVLIPKFERITFVVMGLHLVMTALPLVLLPDVTWQVFLVPTLTGQYIVKNIALLALGMLLVANIKPMSVTHTFLAEDEPANVTLP